MPASQDRVDTEQIRRAVLALQQFFTKQQRQDTTSHLFPEEARDTIAVQVALKKIPDTSRSKLRSIALPHSLRSKDVEMCLFVKDEAKPAIKAALAQTPVPGLTKIMTLKKLKSHYRQFEDKRKLVSSYDLFLADDRILNCLAQPLGKTFFSKKKQPTAVTLARKGVQVSNATLKRTLEAARDATHFRLSTGPCFTVRAAWTNMTADQVVANVETILAECMRNHVPRGWKNVQAVYLKTTHSVALPVYTTLPGDGMLKIPRRVPETLKQPIQGTDDRATMTQEQQPSNEPDVDTTPPTKKLKTFAKKTKKKKA